MDEIGVIQDTLLISDLSWGFDLRVHITGFLSYSAHEGAWYFPLIA